MKTLPDERIEETSDYKYWEAAKMAKVSVKKTVCKVCGQVETIDKFCFIENGEHFTFGSEFVDPQLVKVGC